jgi:iron complex transport system ATP-binding protein
MVKEEKEILCVDSLNIGYVSGRKKTILLPPLNASAKEGELIAIIGRNGIGKSTLLRTLAGIQMNLGGGIFYSGKNINDYSRNELALKVGYISTEQVKVPNMSIYDLVSIGRYPHTNWFGKINSNDHRIIMGAIEMTSMSEFCHKNISELSDGERQKAMIARILAQDAGLMIMDEPTAFLDIGSKYEILHLMHQLTRNSGKTIIFSTHDLQSAVSQADKIWLILDTQLREGAPEDLMIEGAFDHLFESSHVQFNSADGTFSFRGADRGNFYVEGRGSLKHWTEEALKREGYLIVKELTDPFIKVSVSGRKTWTLVNEDSSYEFYSVYELMNFLHKNGGYPT